MKHLFGLIFAATLLTACSNSEGKSSVDIAEEGDSDAERLVFASARSGEGDIYVYERETQTAFKLLGSEQGEGGLAYDAYQNRVIYQKFFEDRAELWSGDTRLIVDPNGDTPPAWSPIAEEILYSARRDGRENIYLLNIATQEERRLTDGDFVDRYPVYSPDGRQALFARRTEAGWALYTLTFSDGAINKLTETTAYVGHPTWSPNGAMIAYDTFINGQAEIALYDFETGAFTRLTNREGNDLRPAWSRDSRRIAFGADPQNENEWELYELTLGTGQIERLTSSKGFDGAPIYVPDSAIQN